MGDMTKNFSRKEFACKGTNCCGHSAPISPLLIDALEKLRAIVGKPLVINSGFRCKTHNAKIGGAVDSRHTFGDAADVKTPSELTDEQFAKLAEQVEAFRTGGIGIYSGRVHLDVRKIRARWNG